jgi:hypothetical protein
MPDERTNPWVAAEHGWSRPVAAPLERCAELLGVTVDQLAPHAARIEPYQHAGGYPCWSLALLERALWPERFAQPPGKTRRRRSKLEDDDSSPIPGRSVETVDVGGAL